MGVCDSVTLSLSDSEANEPPIISAACYGIGPKKFLGPIGQKSKNFHKNDIRLNKILNDCDQTNFNIGQLFSSHLVCLDGPIGH